MQNFGPAELFALSSILLVVIGIALIPLIFFCLTLQKCLKRCSLQNRAMSPGMVWLLLIPLFNIVWQFIVVLKISESLAREFKLRNILSEPEPGKSIGLAFCILYLCGIIPLLGILASIAGLVCWILYWVKIANYSAQIEAPYSAAGETMPL